MKARNSNILTINGGSSSIKFAVYKMAENPNKILSGQIKRIGMQDPSYTIAQKTGDENQIEIDVKNLKEAAEFLIDWLKEHKYVDRIDCLGHCIVHGMERTHLEIINDSLLKELNKISEYDPDHFPAEIAVIELFKKQFPSLLQVACFDTSFHTTMPLAAKILPIPRRLDKAGIRRYGFHGLSYAYLIEALKI